MINRQESRKGKVVMFMRRFTGIACRPGESHRSFVTVLLIAAAVIGCGRNDVATLLPDGGASPSARVNLSPTPDQPAVQSLPKWEAAMATPPKSGCFKAQYPSVEWQEVPCVKAQNTPLRVPGSPLAPPSNASPMTQGLGTLHVGGAVADFLAVVGSDSISSAMGSFSRVTGVTRVTDSSYGNNRFSLQMNTNFFPGGKNQIVEQLGDGLKVDLPPPSDATAAYLSQAAEATRFESQELLFTFLKLYLPISQYKISASTTLGVVNTFTVEWSGQRMYSEEYAKFLRACFDYSNLRAGNILAHAGDQKIKGLIDEMKKKLELANAVSHPYSLRQITVALEAAQDALAKARQNKDAAGVKAADAVVKELTEFNNCYTQLEMVNAIKADAYFSAFVKKERSLSLTVVDMGRNIVASAIITALANIPELFKWTIGRYVRDDTKEHTINERVKSIVSRARSLIYSKALRQAELAEEESAGAGVQREARMELGSPTIKTNGTSVVVAVEYKNKIYIYTPREYLDALADPRALLRKDHLLPGEKTVGREDVGRGTKEEGRGKKDEGGEKKEEARKTEEQKAKTEGRKQQAPAQPETADGRNYIDAKDDKRYSSGLRQGIAISNNQGSVVKSQITVGTASVKVTPIFTPDKSSNDNPDHAGAQSLTDRALNEKYSIVSRSLYDFPLSRAEANNWDLSIIHAWHYDAKGRSSSLLDLSEPTNEESVAINVAHNNSGAGQSQKLVVEFVRQATEIFDAKGKHDHEETKYLIRTNFYQTYGNLSIPITLEYDPKAKTVTEISGGIRYSYHIGDLVGSTGLSLTYDEKNNTVKAFNAYTSESYQGWTISLSMGKTFDDPSTSKHNEGVDNYTGEVLRAAGMGGKVNIGIGYTMQRDAEQKATETATTSSNDLRTVDLDPGKPQQVHNVFYLVGRSGGSLGSPAAQVKVGYDTTTHSPVVNVAAQGNSGTTMPYTSLTYNANGVQAVLGSRFANPETSRSIDLGATRTHSKSNGANDTGKVDTFGFSGSITQPGHSVNGGLTFPFGDLSAGSFNMGINFNLGGSDRGTKKLPMAVLDEKSKTAVFAVVGELGAYSRLSSRVEQAKKGDYALLSQVVSLADSRLVGRDLREILRELGVKDTAEQNGFVAWRDAFDYTPIIFGNTQAEEALAVAARKELARAGFNQEKSEELLKKLVKWAGDRAMEGNDGKARAGLAAIGITDARVQDKFIKWGNDCRAGEIFKNFEEMMNYMSKAAKLAEDRRKDSFLSLSRQARFLRY